MDTNPQSQSDNRNPQSAPWRIAIMAPWIVLVVSLTATIVVTLNLHKSLHRAEEQRFRREVAYIQGEIHTRIEAYIATLRAGSALFSHSDKVTREEFRSFAQSLDLQKYYPGIQGIGFTQRLQPDEVERFIQQTRAAGTENFRIWPETPRDEYHTILYLEPLDRRNQVAIGYDMFTHPVRRAAMERARDTGQPAASGRVTLVQEIDDNKQAGFLIYVPVYRSGSLPDTLEQRRRQLVGFSYAPFRADDLLQGIFRNRPEQLIAFRVYDGDDVNPENLLHDHVGTTLPRSAAYRSTEPFDAAGHPWTIEYFSTPAFDRHHNHRYVIAVAAGGVLLSMVLFGLTRAQTNARLHAEKTAADLQQSELALRRSEIRFRRLSDSNIVGVAFSIPDGTVVDANDECCRIFGCTREQISARQIRWPELTPLEHLPADHRATQEVREHGVSTPYEKEYLRPDGNRIPVLMGIAAIDGNGGETVAIIVDLTERKKAEQALDDARQAAEQANRLKDDFLATVSHELRTPLNAILGWTQLLRAERATPEDREHGMEVIERSARAQAQLIDDLLDVSRIISGNMRLQVQAVDVQPIIDAAITSIQPAAQAKALQIERQLVQPLPQVLADPVRLQQIIWNLLSNAIKFTPRQGRITIRAEQADTDLRLSITDTGIGIEPELLPFVFERFRQGDASFARKFGGLGLGLGIVRHLVELHGGTVSATSEGKDRGATFCVVLPVAEPTDTLPPAAQPRQQAVHNNVLSGTIMLVVDDEPDARDLLARLLESHGAEVVQADSVEQAMSLLENVKVDMVLSDLGMPDADGYALIRALRALSHEQGRTIPAIAVTAYARQQDRERTLREGFDMHLSKPLDPGELLSVVTTLLGRTVA